MLKNLLKLQIILHQPGCPEPKKSPYPIDYPVPDFGQDHDIKDSLKHLDDSEAKHGPWVLPPKNETTSTLFPTNNTLASAKQMVPAHKSALAVSADIQQKDDPICSSAGCTQYKHPEYKTHPMDYPVADFGVDHDIKASDSHTTAAEKSLGHTWNPDQDDDGKWIVPTEDAEFKLTATNADIRMGSDPTCISTGCETRHSNPTKASEEILYAPLDNPLDHDIQSSIENLASVETTLGKKMDLAEVQLDSQMSQKAKTAVKTQIKATQKAQAKKKLSEFAQLRENMMSNWGLHK
jgi:hypothetical protein